MNRPNLSDPPAAAVIADSRSPTGGNKRFLGWCIYLVILCAAFALRLREFAIYTAHSDVHSYVLLVPFVTAYLLYIRWKQLSGELTTSWGPAAVFAAVGVSALFASQHFSNLGQNDHMTLIALAFVCFALNGAFLFLGRKWARSAMFPLFFLAFLIPLPEIVVETLEEASKQASAEVASWLFLITGTPFLRTETMFQLPGITIAVARECSGIRSSLVLIITSLLAANMFLRTTWRRTLLVAAVIPLGLFRNAVRILVISLLSVHIGPHMINSLIHRRGGPVFFVASLIPLFVMLWWLRRREVAAQQQGTPESSKSISADASIV
jgi:exosortase C (VPDSG-CTERM-specific)